MPPLKDLSGEKFGRLVVIGRSARFNNSGAFWFCQCACGNLTCTNGRHMRSGRSKSCGCRMDEHGNRNEQHGEARTRLYGIYKGIKTRCTNRARKSANYYAEKGISISLEWSTFAAFREWSFANGYTDGMTIHRIDSGDGYTPANCKWLPKSEHMAEDARKSWDKFKSDHTATRRTKWGGILKGGSSSVF